MWCITLIDLQILKNPCIPGIKPTWSWCMIFLIGCWILFARMLLRMADIIFKVRAGGSFLKSLKTWSPLPARLSPRDLVMGGISWDGLFENPWKPDSPCLSGFLPYGLVRGKVSWADFFENSWKPDSPCPSDFLPYGLFRDRVLCVGSRQSGSGWILEIELFGLYYGLDMG